MGAHRYINNRKLPPRREEHNIEIEIRNSKQITNDQKNKILKHAVQVDLLFRISRFVAFSLFRISCFGFLFR